MKEQIKLRYYYLKELGQLYISKVFNRKSFECKDCKGKGFYESVPGKPECVMCKEYVKDTKTKSRNEKLRMESRRKFLVDEFMSNTQKYSEDIRSMLESYFDHNPQEQEMWRNKFMKDYGRSNR